ncbi:MAG: HAD-IB family phosphatase [Anaerolineaceae bacterium]|nr:HAD-IB family phosphatase [Anaerolineaceae bacterium]MDE0329100.1 HAD-IB family phosphatase [Anaerolineaceae bacterium]
MATRWGSYDLIFFDCDSTLSAIEGIDELARLKGKGWRVSVLTERAMNGELDLAGVYGKRLQAIRPTRGQVNAIVERYQQTLVPDAQALLDALQFLGKTVFIISGGLAEPVRGLGQRLGIPAERIRAVELEYDRLAGEWWRYHEAQTQHHQAWLDYQVGPLTVSSGKPLMVSELAGDRPGRRLMIGDGVSDLATREVVDLFVGYGGVTARDAVREHADAFIHCPSLAPLLPVAAGPAGWRRLQGTAHQALFEKGLRLAQSGQLSLNRDPLRQAFAGAFASETT